MVRGLSLCLAISLLLSIGILGMAGAGNDWDMGENRIHNGDFENDNIGEPPNGWSLQKGG